MGSVFHNLFTELLICVALVTVKGHAQPMFASSRGTFSLPDVIIFPVCTYQIVIKYLNLPEASLTMQDLKCWLK